jgi:hypothetical protein
LGASLAERVYAMIAEIDGVKNAECAGEAAEKGRSVNVWDSSPPIGT